MENVKLYGKDVFKIIRIVNKMNLKKDMGRIFKLFMDNDDKNKNASTKLQIALGKKANTPENVAKILEKEIDLKLAFKEIQDFNMEVLEEVIFLIIEKLNVAEEEVFDLIASVYNKDVETIRESTEIDELVSMIKGIVTCDGISKVFTLIFK